MWIPSPQSDLTLTGCFAKTASVHSDSAVSRPLSTKLLSKEATNCCILTEHRLGFTGVAMDLSLRIPTPWTQKTFFSVQPTYLTETGCYTWTLVVTSRSDPGMNRRDVTVWLRTAPDTTLPPPPIMPIVLKIMNLIAAQLQSKNRDWMWSSGTASWVERHVGEQNGCVNHGEYTLDNGGGGGGGAKII